MRRMALPDPLAMAVEFVDDMVRYRGIWRQEVAFAALGAAVAAGSCTEVDIEWRVSAYDVRAWLTIHPVVYGGMTREIPVEAGVDA